MILPLDFEIFDIFTTGVFLFFFENSRKILKKNLKLSQFLNCLTQHEIISKKTIVYGCLQHGITQNSVAFVVYESEY